LVKESERELREVIKQNQVPMGEAVFNDNRLSQTTITTPPTEIVGMTTIFDGIPVGGSVIS